LEDSSLTIGTLQLVITVVISLIASSGFWLFLTQRLDRKSLTSQLLLGLAHDRIIYLGLTYIKRGSITKDEYENIHGCIYTPYQKMGGNGFAKKIIDEINKLPIREASLLEVAEETISTPGKKC
jgi:hypothetical protein